MVSSFPRRIENTSRFCCKAQTIAPNMTPRLALIVCVLFISWLFAMRREGRAKAPAVIWLPTLWVVILGSRPVSSWFGIEVQAANGDAYLEGSPFDRLIYLFLISSAFLILLKRGVSWGSIAASNKWIVIYFLYFGISVLWSDFPFVAFKRWTKDLGNVFMVLLILSEPNPIESMKTVFRRCLYLLIPLSVLFIKYFPELGISYDPWEGQQFVQGVALTKNSLGSTVAVCTLFLVWELLERHNKGPGARTKIERINSFLLLAMAMWLLVKANSATAFSCTMLGSAGLFATSLPAVRKRLDRFAAYVTLGACAALFFYAVFDLQGGALQMLGKDATLTGRTEIWQMVLDEKTNPLIGAGFYSFFMGSRVARFWETYSLNVNQAHNGYVQTYLDGGAIGVCLLVMMLWSSGRTIAGKLVAEPYWAGPRAIFCAIILLYNWTEATFSRLSPLWFVLLLVIMEYPRTGKARCAGESETPTSAHLQATPIPEQNR
jgi:exopolysaccharide production protein ExoQ